MSGIEALRSLAQQAFDNAKSEKQQEKNKTNFNIIEKELKVLEFIIKKDVIIPKLILTKNFDIKEYNKDLSETRQLTNEERVIILETLKELESEQK